MQGREISSNPSSQETDWDYPYEGEDTKLRKLGTTSVSGKCPTLYETDTGDIVVQGYRLVDAEALA